jgi:hypothetical protein
MPPRGTTVREHRIIVATAFDHAVDAINAYVSSLNPALRRRWSVNCPGAIDTEPKSEVLIAI